MPTTQNTSTNVTSGKPAVAGSIFRALPSNNLTIPTTVSETLSSDFKCMGYISEDGITNANGYDNDTIKAWGGDIVLPLQTGKTDTFTFKMLEILNEEVLKAVFIDSNVTVTAASSSAPKTISVTANSKDQPDVVWVIDMILRGNNPRRIVIPCGKITSVADITYSDDDAVGYEVTISCSPDTNGNTHYEYTTIGTATT